MKPSLLPSGRRATARLGVVVVCLLGAWTDLVQAAPTTQVWQAVSDRTLDRQRGGLSFGGGLEVSFGITRSVFINDLEFKLTEAAIETLSVLAEARMDDDVMTGVQIEAMISGKPESDCDEASGATRVKRLRDALGNQLVSELLVKTIARRGYVLAVDKDTIRVI